MLEQLYPHFLLEYLRTVIRMSTSAPTVASSRSGRLSKFFSQILFGKQTVQNASQGKLFLEAICDQDDHSNCIEKLIANPSALEALRKSLRFDNSPAFINGPASDFIQYLTEPQVKQLCNGQLLQQIIILMVEPPTFLNALLYAHQNRILDRHNSRSFAWLLLELLHLPADQAVLYRDIAESITADRSLLDSPSLEARTLGQKIKHLLQTLSNSISQETGWSAGGRHDNDHIDFRQISIMPTADELSSIEKSFYRRADVIFEAEPDKRAGMHLDNQFRLLREDMLGEFRTALQIVRGKKKGRRTGFNLRGLSLAGVSCGTFLGSYKRKPCAIMMTCFNGLRQLDGLNIDQKKSFLKDNRNFLKHQSLGCLLDKDELIAFATIDRNEDLLVEDIICLHISSEAAFTKALLVAKISNSLQFVQVDTPVFAYEPVLKQLQNKLYLPLAEELLFLDSTYIPRKSAIRLEALIEEIRDKPDGELQGLLGTPKKIKLDESQVESLLTGLSLRVSLIQGPPGTGKSFIGALLAKVIHDQTSEKILVLCYTNHALDQFLEDLLDIGIPADSMLRLGSKSSAKTKSLGLYEQTTTYKTSGGSWEIIDARKAEAQDLEDRLTHLTAGYRDMTVGKDDLLEYLEFSACDSHFHAALSTPAEEDGMTRVGRRGKAVGKHYLLDRWSSGLDPGVFLNRISESSAEVWQLDTSARQIFMTKWATELFEEHAARINELARNYNNCQKSLNDLLNERNVAIIKSKRIIGCTTTAAAMYAQELQAASPGVVLVEEAGEIYESHIIAAMGPGTKQLILIGDHKQLRPKSNNYELTVEKGNGYDFNRSLFERLVLAGLPHTTLLTQHRMCPEISSLVRRLTYPDLLDAPGTQNRPNLRGFQDKLIFLDHNHPEVETSELADRKDGGSKSSKQNAFEADMVLACVRYLAQQGYGTNKLVVLTPYLGQLKLLLDNLSRDHDPVLSDLDSYDLVQAGLLPEASAKLSKRPIKISTIDNYQGEESDIIIATLTRSNENGDIGFLRAPERLNVLISRARNALIIIGNSKTFMNARNGKEVWRDFLEQLKSGGHIYSGFPVKCERHPEKKAILRRREDFESECPDGGCSDPCGTKLNCGLHDCPQRCHQLSDHSKMECKQVMEEICSQNHKLSWQCYKKRPKTCPRCEKEARERAEKLKRGHALEVQRENKQREYARTLAAVKEEIAIQRQKLKDELDEKERQLVLQQHKAELRNITAAVTRLDAGTRYKISLPPQAIDNMLSASAVQSATITPVATPDIGQTNDPMRTPTQSQNEDVLVPLTSRAKDEWEHQKKFEGASNDALDSLMDMIGLEDIKLEFLSIKARVDTVVRQNASLKDERFGAALLGNPGTGKTTVARLYAKFLTSMGVLPGDFFIETTGSRLSNDGVSGCKKHLEDIQNNGGGALFIDEAYQLVTGYGGTQVLDFLLAEIENLTGKVVFILAGYNKQMESFFAHNPGIPSRIPVQLQFADYNDNELLQILAHQVEKKYKGAMKVEGGMGGLLSRIVARRIGRGRGREGFGNARAVHNVFTQLAARQAERLTRERRAGQIPDDYQLTKEDLLGPEPSSALAKNVAWTKLQELIGLKSVKQSVQVLFDRIQINYNRELEEKSLIDCSLNRVFLGSPGTGKTSVAKIYGQILADLGLLSNGEVVVKNPADFVGSVLGQSESNTKAILAATVGKVLIIDEAYMLAGNLSESGAQADPYKTAVIDTIVAEVQSTATEDRCVLLLGYKDQMEEMFQKVNPGLSRRFPIDSAFVFEDFTDDELEKILQLKLKQQGFHATDQAKRVALDVLSRARNRPHFGNAGEVDILLDKAKARHQVRLSSGETKNLDGLEARDFDEDFDRGARASTNCRKLFEGVVGCEDLISQLEGYQRIAESMRQRGLDPRDQIPFNFLFRGPPGTGKTTTARRMGKIYYDMGFLANAQVVECSATDLVGQYVGQTGPKTQKILEKALGKVLFIDEAYRLAAGQFAKEAMDEIVDCLTKPKFSQKLIVILAGYDADINRLMSINPGLTSRFPETVIFQNLLPNQCLQLLSQELTRKSIDATIFKSSSENLQRQLLQFFAKLSKLPSWGNARDIQSLAKTMRGSLLKSAKSSTSPLVLGEDLLMTSIKAMISERAHRAQLPHPLEITMLPKAATQALPNNPPQVRTEVNTSTTASSGPPIAPPEIDKQAKYDDPRDSGVSDTTWERLQEDKRAAEVLIQQEQQIFAKEKALQAALETSTAKVEQLVNSPADDEARRQHEAARLQLEKERREVELELQRQAEQAKQARKKRVKEVKAQQKLRQMGVCVVGYRWIKQAAGYRCAGGSHFIGNSELGLED